MSVSKWKAEIERIALDEGVERVKFENRRSGHLRVTLVKNGTERRITTSLSPSDFRAGHKVRTDVRRVFA